MREIPRIDPTLAWSAERRVGSSEARLLDRLIEGGPWNGPLIISMPRTGSTLLGTMLLLAHDPPGSGRSTFERYVHEPVAPVFWEGKPVESILEVTGGSLGPGDVVQESAYQFASAEIARWFVRNARGPIALTLRDPRMSWPSRWRIMIREWLDSDPNDPEAARLQAAVAAEDYSDLGDLLTTRVSQPDNGWYAFLSILEMCETEGTGFVLVENSRFRADPDGVLAGLCKAWGIPFDPALTSWTDLEHIRSRIVMSDLAAGPEYDWYYADTLGSSSGIVRADREPLPLDRFPEILRGDSESPLTIDRAVHWYEQLLELPETL